MKSFNTQCTNTLVRELRPGDAVICAEDADRCSLALVIGKSPGTPYRWPGKLLLLPWGEIRSWSDEWWAKRVTIVNELR